MKTFKFLLIILMAVIGWLAFKPATAFTDPNKYVRVANYYLLSNIPREDWPALARYDLVILTMEAQFYDPGFREFAKRENPDIMILAYVPSQSINIEFLDDASGIRRRLKDGIQSDWYLNDSAGNRLSTWQGIWNTNVTTGWSDYLAEFVDRELMSTGFWDGVMYDMVWENVDWVNSGEIDLNRDGVKDEATNANEAWRHGMTRLLSTTRVKLGPDKIVLTNGSSLADYQPYTNGRMFESFPTPWEGRGAWADSMRPYLTLAEQNLRPVTHVVNGNTDDTGNARNYRDMRFALTSTLMGDGYFSYDYGVTSHAQLWWYDEYDTTLGRPVSGVKPAASEDFMATADYATIGEGFWRREFQNGLVLVNATAETKHLEFDEEYEKIHGTQDQAVNSGEIVTEVSVGPEDGVILLRPLQEIVGEVYNNGSFARIFNKDGQVRRTGFFAYDGEFKGGERVIKIDLDHDGRYDYVVAGKNQVEIYNAEYELIKRFYPYGKEFDAGVNLAVGDVNRDGLEEIVTGTKNGGGPEIKIFNHRGEVINPGFFAYGAGFKGGVNVGVGDLNGDGWQEIIAGAGYGGGPHIRVFNGEGRLINPGFFAYDPKFRGGVNVAVGDLNGDRVAEIVSAPGPSGGPHIRVFNRDGKLINPGFFAYDENNRQGIGVIVSDLDGDGIDEVLATTADVFTVTALRYTESISTGSQLAIDRYLEWLAAPAKTNFKPEGEPATLRDEDIL